MAPSPAWKICRRRRALVDPSVDAVLVSPGMLKHVRHAFNFKGAPIPIVRINWSTVFCFDWGYNRAQTVAAFSVREAVALGAEIVLISLTLKTGDEANDARNVEVFSRARAKRLPLLGVPVLGECFPNNSDDISPAEMHDQVLRGTRIIAELGADLIKTFHTQPSPKSSTAAPCRYWDWAAIRSRMSWNHWRSRNASSHEGARGVVFGRNAIQRPDPRAYQRALCDVVKRGVTPEDAAEKHGL